LLCAERPSRSTDLSDARTRSRNTHQDSRGLRSARANQTTTNSRRISMPIKDALPYSRARLPSRYSALPPHTTWQRGSAKGNPKSDRVVSYENSPHGWFGSFLTTGIDQIPPLAWGFDLLKAAAEKLTFGGPSRDKRWLDLRRQMREMPRN